MTNNITNLKFKFFFDRGKELLNKKTLDTYRIKVMNPKLIFEELLKVLNLYEKDLIHHFEPAVTDIVEEALFFINDDNGLYFNQVSQTILVKVLKEISKSKKTDHNKRLKLLIQTLLAENNNYNINVILKLKELVLSETNYEEDLKKIDKLLSYLLTGLIGEGFSRKYLNNLLHKFFKNNSNITNSFEQFQSYCNKEKDEYLVYFKGNFVHGVKEFRLPPNIRIINSIERNILTFRPEHVYFLELKHNYRFIEVKVRARDFISALNISKIILAEMLDVFNSGFIKNVLEIDNIVCVQFNNIYRMYQIEDEVDLYDKYKDDDTVFEEFINDYYTVGEQNNVLHEKIHSAIRYLRFGNQSYDIEHKFLNYWIAMEYLYTNPSNPQSNTIGRIKNYYPKIHSAFYWTRKIIYFKNLLDRIEISNVNGIDVTFETLQKSEVYDNIIAEYKEVNPLLYYKSKQLKTELFTERNSIISNHCENLAKHLTRIYRIRNQIVHEASTDMNIEMITSNLKYYLIFSLERIIWTISDNDLLNSIENVFTYYEIAFDKNLLSTDISEIINVDDFKTMIE